MGKEDKHRKFVVEFPRPGTLHTELQKAELDFPNKILRFLSYIKFDSLTAELTALLETVAFT
jgi:hypothetical protein